MNQIQNGSSLVARLGRLGFDSHEVCELVRIERTLHRWAEEECNGTIQRDGEQGDGKPRRWYQTRGGERIRGAVIPDREAGALRRLTKLMATHTGQRAYIQGDPRGCQIYIVDLAELGTRDVDSCYSSFGVAVCVEVAS